MHTAKDTAPTKDEISSGTNDPRSMPTVDEAKDVESGQEQEGDWLAGIPQGVYYRILRESELPEWAQYEAPQHIKAITQLLNIPIPAVYYMRPVQPDKVPPWVRHTLLDYRHLRGFSVLVAWDNATWLWEPEEIGGQAAHYSIETLADDELDGAPSVNAEWHGMPIYSRKDWISDEYRLHINVADADGEAYWLTLSLAHELRHWYQERLLQEYHTTSGKYVRGRRRAQEADADMFACYYSHQYHIEDGKVVIGQPRVVVHRNESGVQSRIYLERRCRYCARLQLHRDWPVGVRKPKQETAVKA